jgi:hypothetical protein
MSASKAGWTPFPHIRQVAATAKALKERHIPYTVIGAQNLKNLKRKAIALAGVLRLSEEAAEDIRKFVRDGGAVYASGDSGIDLLGDVLGLKPTPAREAESYISPVEKSGIFPKIRPMSAGTQRIAEALPGARVLAKIALPYTDPSDFSRFASIHSNPPGRKTEHPAVIANGYGKGKSIWMAGAIESRGEKEQSDAFANAIGYLIGGEFSHCLEAPPVAEAVVFDAGTHLIASILNVQEILPAVALHGAKLKVALIGRSVDRVLLLPDETELAFDMEGGYVVIALPPVELLVMVKILVK